MENQTQSEGPDQLQGMEQKIQDLTARLEAVEGMALRGDPTQVPHATQAHGAETIVRKITMMGEGFGLTGIAVMKETLWVVHGAQSFLYAYPLATPNQPQKIQLRNLKDAENITMCHPERSELMISDRGTNTLMTIEVKQVDNIWEVERSRVVKLRFPPWGLGVDQGELLVCDGEEIHIFALSCKPTGRVNTPSTIRPWKALPRPASPGFVVRDVYNKQICLLNENGDIIHTYKGQNGIRSGDIACHGQSIYVTDEENSTIDQLNKDGGYVRKVIGEKQGLCKPCRLCVDEKGTIYVAHQGDKGKMEVLVIESS